jgi:hypothetical protein
MRQNKIPTMRSMGSASAVAAFVPFELCLCIQQSSYTWPPHELLRCGNMNGRLIREVDT